MSTATDMLAEYLAAESLVLQGKEATIGGARFRREDLAAIRAGRKEWEDKVAAEQGKAYGAPTIGGLKVSVADLSQ